jgi:hypothetical protein
MQHDEGDNKSVIISVPVAPNPLCYYAICAGAFYNLYIIDLNSPINKKKLKAVFSSCIGCATLGRLMSRFIKHVTSNQSLLHALILFLLMCIS